MIKFNEFLNCLQEFNSNHEINLKITELKDMLNDPTITTKEVNIRELLFLKKSIQKFLENKAHCMSYKC